MCEHSSLPSPHQSDGLVRINPVQGVSQILLRASMSGTNKLGLLLVLFDLAPSRMKDNTPISRNELTNQYLRIHWQHARPYRRRRLRQSHGNSSQHNKNSTTDTVAMAEIHRLRRRILRNHRSLANRPLEVVLNHMRRYPGCYMKLSLEFDKARLAIDDALWRNPVRKLHTFDRTSIPFIYTVQGDSLQFIAGVPRQLTEAAPVLRPLVELRFVEVVTRLNRRGATSREHSIYAHLFGTQRSMPSPPMKKKLRSSQGDKCLYTGVEFDENTPLAADHVIPWWLHPVSDIQNFVVTLTDVNRKKGGWLLGPSLVEDWVEYILNKSQDLRKIGDDHRWPSSLQNVKNVSLGIYITIPPDTGVWQGVEKGVQPIGENGKRRAIAALKKL